MTPQLDPALLAKARRAPRRDGLTFEERMALNLFWRKDVRVPVLVRVFQCSKNTIYSNCLTGDAPSYAMAARRRSTTSSMRWASKRRGTNTSLRGWSMLLTPPTKSSSRARAA